MTTILDRIRAFRGRRAASAGEKLAALVDDLVNDRDPALKPAEVDALLEQQGISLELLEARVVAARERQELQATVAEEAELRGTRKDLQAQLTALAEERKALLVELDAQVASVRSELDVASRALGRVTDAQQKLRQLAPPSARQAATDAKLALSTAVNDRAQLEGRRAHLRAELASLKYRLGKGDDVAGLIAETEQGLAAAEQDLSRATAAEAAAERARDETAAALLAAPVEREKVDA